MHALAPVLLAEDDPNEAYLLQRAFVEAGVGHPLLDVRDGQQAISYLEGSGSYSNRHAYPLPCLLLLDLNMPVCDGFEVLRWLGGRPGLRTHIPVVVLTDSYNREDMARADQLGARAYFIKPYSQDIRVQLARELSERWLVPGTPPGAPRLILPPALMPVPAGADGLRFPPSSSQNARN